MTSIYQGWSPSQELEERLKLANDLADTTRDYCAMRRFIDANMRNGFYVRHPVLLHLDNIAIGERIMIMQQAADRIADYEAHSPSVEDDGEDLEITPFFAGFHPEIPAMPVQVMGRTDEIGKNLHTTSVAYEGQSRPGWSG